MSNSFDINKPLTTKLKELILEECTLRGQTIIPKYVLDKANFKLYEDWYKDAYVASVDIAIASLKNSKTLDTTQKTITKELARYPKTLWDYIKQEYAPQWFIKKHPVEYVEYHQSITHITENKTQITNVFPSITLDQPRQILRIYETANNSI